MCRIRDPGRTERCFDRLACLRQYRQGCRSGYSGADYSFANAVVSPAIEFKAEGFIMGIGAKMFVIAGPVLVYGITASVIYGIIVYVFGLY